MPVRQISSRVSAAADMAMRYQRAETDRDRALAKAMSEEVARQPIPCRPRKPATDLQSDLPTWQSGASTKQEDCVDAAVEGAGDVALEAPPDLTAGLGLALERVTRIELA